jgi:hypothetical protein
MASLQVYLRGWAVCERLRENVAGREIKTACGKRQFVTRKSGFGDTAARFFLH